MLAASVPGSDRAAGDRVDRLERLLAAGELVGVWPEGFKGIGKPFTERYKLQRFGRGGFVAAALRTGVPNSMSHFDGSGTRPSGPSHGNVGVIGR